MISSYQIRAARALLGLSAAELAKRAGLSHRTLQRFETHDGIPDSRLGNLEAIEHTLTELGVLFIGDPLLSPGVQLRTHHRETKPSD
jgi:transcriptional regulator with XRE-family HTH domain